MYKILFGEDFHIAASNLTKGFKLQSAGLSYLPYSYGKFFRNKNIFGVEDIWVNGILP